MTTNFAPDGLKIEFLKWSVSSQTLATLDELVVQLCNIYPKDQAKIFTLINLI